jgi:hypothetical protein
MDEWRWPNFSPEELACRGTGKLAIDKHSMDMLQELRNRLGKPIILNSAYRSPEHNRRVGGAKQSFHLKAMAYDCRQDNQDPQEFIHLAKAVGFNGIGQYADKGFTHIDSRVNPATFGSKNWPKSSTRHTPQFQPEPDAKKGQRALTETGGVGLIIAAGREVVKEAAPVLTEQQLAYASAAVALIGLFFIVRKYMRNEDE